MSDAFAAQFEFWAREVAVPTLRRQCLALEREGLETGYDHLRGRSVRFFVRLDRGARPLFSLSFTPQAGERRIAVSAGEGAARLKAVEELDAAALAEMTAAFVRAVPARTLH